MFPPGVVRKKSLRKPRVPGPVGCRVCQLEASEPHARDIPGRLRLRLPVPSAGSGCSNGPLNLISSSRARALALAAVAVGPGRACQWEDTSHRDSGSCRCQWPSISLGGHCHCPAAQRQDREHWHAGNERHWQSGPARRTFKKRITSRPNQTGTAPACD